MRGGPPERTERAKTRLFGVSTLFCFLCCLQGSLLKPCGEKEPKPELLPSPPHRFFT